MPLKKKKTSKIICVHIAHSHLDLFPTLFAKKQIQDQAYSCVFTTKE